MRSLVGRKVQVVATGEQDAEYAASFPELGTVVVDGSQWAQVVFPDRGRVAVLWDQLYLCD